MIDYQLKRSKRKTIQIKITMEGTVIVTAPSRLRKSEIDSIIKRKEDWIIKKQNSLRNATEQFAVDASFLKEQVLYLGQPYSVDVVFDPNFYKITVGLYGEKIYIMSREFEEMQLKQALEHWYRQETKQIIENRIEIYGQQIPVQIQGIRIKDQKTRWGSASSKGNLNFNLRLAMAPIEVIDYVVIHEMCHLLEMNHSERFWKLVEQYLPDYEKQRKWLSDNGWLLTEGIQSLKLDFN